MGKYGKYDALMGDEPAAPAGNKYAALMEDEETPEEKALRESFLDKKKFRPSPGQRKFPAGDIDAQLARASADVEDLSNTVPRKIGGAVNSALDRYSFGLYGRALEDAGKLEGAARRGLGVGGKPYLTEAAESIPRYREEHPVVSGITDAPAYLAEGPANILFRGVERAIPAVAGRIANAGRGALAASATGAVQSASEAGARGEAPAGIARGALEGAAGGLAGGSAIGGTGALLGGLGQAVVNSRGGRARQFLEDRGVTVGPRSPGRGGPMESMETQGTTDADIGIQGAASAERAVDALNRKHLLARRRIGASIDEAAASPEGQRQYDVTDIENNIRRSAEDMGVSPVARQGLQQTLGDIRSRNPPPPPPEPVPPEVQADLEALTSVRDMLKTRVEGGGASPSALKNLQAVEEQIQALTPPSAEPTEPLSFLSATDVNRMRRGLDRTARTGLSVDEKFHPLRQAADETRDLVREGPFAVPNMKYAVESANQRRDRRLLGLPERKVGPEESPTAVGKVTNRIIRKGSNTVTAGKEERELEQFGRRNPEIRLETERPEILRRRADLALGLLRRHGGLMERGVVGAAHALPIAAAAVTHHPIMAGLGVAGSLALQNLPALQARFLYGPALAARAMEPLLLSSPLLAAGRIHREER